MIEEPLYSVLYIQIWVYCMGTSRKNEISLNIPEGSLVGQAYTECFRVTGVTLPEAYFVLSCEL